MCDIEDNFPEVRCFDEKIRTRLVELEEDLKKCGEPDIIFHYTSASGLKGILETGRIWLTDIFSLNDPSELKHGFSIFVKCLKERAKNCAPIAQLIAERFEQVQKEDGIRGVADFFVCSLSAHENDLAQWRAYADDGRGFALGFDRAALEEGFSSAAGQPRQENLSFPISYGDEKLTKLSQEIIDLAHPMMSCRRSPPIPREAFECYVESVSASLAQSAFQAALLFKHEAYEHEKEYRFLQVHPLPPPDVRNRTRGSALNRYMEFDWRGVAPDALRKVLIGPAADTNNSSRVIHDCITQSLSEEAAKRVEIVHSGIPYRPS